MQVPPDEVEMAPGAAASSESTTPDDLEDDKAHERPEASPPPPIPWSPKRRQLPRTEFAGVAIVFALVVFGLIWRGNAPRLPVLPPRDEARVGEVAASFVPAAPDAEEVVEIAAALEDLLEARRRKDKTAIEARFDTVRLYQEARRIGGFEDASAEQERRLVNNLRDSVVREVELMFDYRRWRVTHCRLSSNRREAVVYARGVTDAGAQGKFRFWVIRSDRSWRIYDWEDVINAMRISDVLAVVGKSRWEPGQALRMKLASEQLVAAQRAAVQADPSASDLLAQVDEEHLIGPFQAARWILQASLDLDAGCPVEALESCRRAEAHRPDAPVLLWLRATAFNGLGRYEEAGKSARRYMEQVGADADGEYQLGLSLQGRGRLEEAAQAHRRGLDDDPNSLDNLVQLGLVLPADEVGELRRRFEAMENPERCFAPLCELYLEQGAAEPFITLLEFRQAKAPDDVQVQYYAAFANRRWSEVIELYEGKVQDAGDRPWIMYRPSLVTAMFHRGRALEAYREVGSPEVVYEQLANLASAEQNPAELEKLNAAHRDRSPGDARLWFWSAEVAWLREEFREAVEILARHRDRIQTQAGYERVLHDRLIRSLIRLEMYDEAALEAQTWYAQTRDPWYGALVFACRGDAPQAMDWLNRCLEFGYHPLQFYADPMLSDALHASALDEVRRAHPNPLIQGPVL